MPQDGTTSPWLRRIIYAIPFVGVIAVLIYNGFSWSRYLNAQVSFDRMQEGTCALGSPDYRLPFQLKTYYYYPLLGTFGMANSSWTEVPCKVNISVYSVDGSRLPLHPGRTLVYFIYWQHFVIDVIHDTCSRLVPKQVQAGRFACSFVIDSEGLVAQGVYVSSKAYLPRYPALFLMKAAGLSLCTLGPIAILMCCCARGAMRRHGASTAREAVASDPGGCSKPLLAVA